MKTNSSFFLSFLAVWAVFLSAQSRLQAEETEEKSLSLEEKQEKVQKLFASVPLLSQNMRPFETLAFSCIREKSTDNGMRWTVVKKSKVAFDIKKGHLKYTVWNHEQEKNRVTYETILRHKDKLYVRNGSTTHPSVSLERDFNVEDVDVGDVEISRCDNIQELYYIIMNIDWLSFWICKGETNLLIQDALGNKMLFDGLLDISFNDSSDEIFIDYWMSRFAISKSRGVVTKRMTSGTQRTADRFISKKGLPIPLVINIDSPWSEPGSLLAKTRYRVTVDEKTLRINEQLEPSEFTITVPAGTRVSDAIKNKSYTLTAPLETLDHSDSIKRLDAMLEEARKAK